MGIDCFTSSWPREGSDEVVISFEETIERALKGPVSMEREFELRVFFKKLTEILKEYDIKYDPSTPIPSDDVLADEVFEAALEFYSEVGTYCLDTNRIIKFDENEIREAIKDFPSRVTFGKGKQIKPRNPESKTLPWCSVGGVGITVSNEEVFRGILRAYAANPLADSICTPSLQTVDGRIVVSESPLEILGAIKTVTLAKETLKDVDRADLPIINGIATSPSDFATAIGSQFGITPSDALELGSIAEMKVDFNLLNKVTYGLKMGIGILAGAGALLGGLCGGPEGTAVVNTAYSFQGLLVQRGVVYHPYPLHLRYVCNSGRDLLWVISVASQAISRNTRMPLLDLSYASAGPTTRMGFYEAAAIAAASVVSGASLEVQGQAKAAIDHLGPLEPRFAVEIAHAAAGMRRADANDLVRSLLSRYEEEIPNPPEGKKSQECIDIKTGAPVKQYLQLYNEIRKEVEDYGIQLR